MTTAVTITPRLREQFHRDGFFILEGVIEPGHLELLRDELDGFIAVIDAEMDAAGVDMLGLNHRGKRYFIAERHRESERLHSFLFSDLMATICRATIGDDAWLFHEQFVVKSAEVGLSFSWHQDSGYLRTFVPTHERPYVTCWCALDDVDEANGTIYVLPFDRAGTRGITEHARDPTTNDLIGYTGDDPGVPVVVPAGSVAVFASTVLHRSGPNTTSQQRRCYLAQYSAERIVHEDGTPSHSAVPFLRAGHVVV